MKANFLPLTTIAVILIASSFSCQYTQEETQESGPPYVVITRHGRVQEGGSLTPVAQATMLEEMALKCPTNSATFYIVNYSDQEERFVQSYNALKTSLSLSIQSQCQTALTFGNPVSLDVTNPSSPTAAEMNNIVNLIKTSSAVNSNGDLSVFILSGGVLRQLGSYLNSAPYSDLAERLSCKSDPYYYRYSWLLTPGGSPNYDVINNAYDYPTLVFPVQNSGSGWDGILESRGLGQKPAPFKPAFASNAAEPTVAAFGGNLVECTVQSGEKVYISVFDDQTFTTSLADYYFGVASNPVMRSVRLGKSSSLMMVFKDLNGSLVSTSTSDPTQMSNWSSNSMVFSGSWDSMYPSLTAFNSSSVCNSTEAYVAYSKPSGNYHQICFSSTPDGATWSDRGCPFQALSSPVSIQSFSLLGQERLFVAYVGATSPNYDQAIFIAQSTDGKNWGRPTTIQSFGPYSYVKNLNFVVEDGELNLYFVESQNPNIQITYMIYDPGQGISWGLKQPIPFPNIMEPLTSVITVF